jgi:hypothetical protein
MIQRASIVLLLLSYFNVAHAQTGSIRAKVIDADSNQPIPFATIYFSKTTIGGYTDANGFVEINKIPFGLFDLVASEISHKLYQRKIIIRSEQPIYLAIKLLPKTLSEVTVTAKRDDKWQRQYERFLRLFFGTEHVDECKITNPGLIDFKVAQGQFLAAAPEPLKIQNNYLGYNLEFDLKACAFSASTFVITGNVRFEEQQGPDSLKLKWIRNRENAYRGSPQHFLKSMIDSSLYKDGYDIYSDLTTAANIVRSPSFLTNIARNISPTSMKRRVKRGEDGLYAINFPYRLEVHYLRKRAQPNIYRNVFHAVSWLEIKGTEKLVVNGDGVVQNPSVLTVLGSMSNLKVAEWLPMNYQYTDTQKVEVIENRPAEVSNTLLEKPYIQTDRNYYYSGETMWLKGYMSYSMPLLKDTLSQSIYVELADANGNVVTTNRYQIQDGMFNGDIVFTRAMKTGPYQLKAYTAWMLNFDRRLIFTKTINLLGENEAVRVIVDYKPGRDTLANVSIHTDKTSYSAREKITVTIDVTDSLDFRTASDLSVAVTDIVQAVPLKNEKTILTNYMYEKAEISDTTTLVKYNIEYGIDFSGQFLVRKKPDQASITVFQENTKETMGIITDEAGKFVRTLSFNDTLNFYLRAMSANNKKGIVVMNQSPVRSPRLDVEPSLLDLYSSDHIQHVQPAFNGARVLKEVTVKATKIDKPQPAVIHGNGDYTVTGDWINERNFTDLFLAIASKVPGLTYSSTDPLNSSISFRAGQFSGMSATPPLILIDNIAVTDQTQVRDIPIRSIERVDIFKFGGSSIYGARAAGGVIAIYTKKGTSGEEEKQGFDKTKLQEVKMFGYSVPAKFTAPDYGDPATDDYLDYRATLYWSPFVTTDGKQPATVSFYAADVATKYRIIVEGITKGGMPIRAEKVIDVVKGN